MKKALVLGIGSAQVDLIRYLKSEGWWVIGCSYQHSGPGLACIDQFELVDIRDCNALEKLVQRERVDLLYSVGSDLAAVSIARISSRFGFPCFVPEETVELLHNKANLRKFLTETSINLVEYKVMTSLRDFQNWRTYPAVMKPADNQGQRGVYFVNSQKDVETNFAKSLSFSEGGKVLLEEYISGPEISVNVLVKDSKVAFFHVSDRILLEGYSCGISRGHVFPSKECVGQALVTTREMIERCIHKLGIENGPVYFQLRLSENGPKIIEITPRLDGCHNWLLIKTANHFDLLASTIGLLTGSFQLPETQMTDYRGCFSLNFFFAPPGTLFKKSEYSAPIHSICREYYYSDGEIVRPINGLVEKTGYYIKQEN